MDEAGGNRRESNNWQVTRESSVVLQSQLGPVVIVDVNAPDGCKDRQTLSAVPQEEAAIDSEDEIDRRN